MISRVTLWSLLAALLIPSGIAVWKSGHRDSCARYLAGDRSQAPTQMVAVGTEMMEVPCTQWLPRQSTWVQIWCVAELGVMLVLLIHAIGDTRVWVNRRRVSRRAPEGGGESVVKIVECPRDAWQGLPGMMAPEIKADYLRVLVAAGFKHIDAVSFVSKAAVPQMADSELVLEYLDPPDDVEIIGIVVNAKGAERAVATSAVQTLGFPYSVSAQFLERNQRQTPEESLTALEQVGEIAFKAGLDVVAYISMAFGNPYGEPWDVDEVVAACDLLVDSGVTQISLADTVGLATPRLIGDVVSDVLAVHEGLEIGVHLHARAGEAAERVRAAYAAGCRRFDAAIGGLGGCPFAQDALVGNIATEELLAELTRLGAELPEMRPLDEIAAASREIARRFGAKVQ